MDSSRVLLQPLSSERWNRRCALAQVWLTCPSVVVIGVFCRAWCRAMTVDSQFRSPWVMQRYDDDSAFFEKTKEQFDRLKQGEA